MEKLQVGMFNKLVEFLTHEHDYVKIGFKQVEDGYSRYSMRKYKCLSCGKEKWIDGRLDNN